MIVKKITEKMNKRRAIDKQIKEAEIRLSLIVIFLFFFGIFIGYFASEIMVQQQCKIAYTSWEEQNSYYVDPDNLGDFLDNLSQDKFQERLDEFGVTGMVVEEMKEVDSKNSTIPEKLA